MTVLPTAVPAQAPSTAQATAVTGVTAVGEVGDFLTMLLAALPNASAPGEQLVDETLDLLAAAGDAALLATDVAEESPDEAPAAVELTDDVEVLTGPVLLAPMQVVVQQAVRLQEASLSGRTPEPTAPEQVTPAATSQGVALTEAVDAPTGTVSGTSTGITTPVAPQTPVEAPSAAPAAAGEGTEPRTAAPEPVAATATRTPDARTVQATPGAIDVSTLTTHVSATAPTAPATTTPTATGPQTGAAPAPVAQQVIGEVSRLVSRGDGTHRLTLTLQPESLGDVRVTLTVRQGIVEVSFEAGDEARRALLESTPELRRLLELTGATESRVTVRDLGVRDVSGAGTGTTTSAGGQAETGPGPDRQAGQDPTGTRRDPQNDHARTRDGQNATDGDHRGVGASRPHDPVTATRSAGLDVTV